MFENLQFYAMAGVYILAGVLLASAIVAVMEKLLGIETRPRSHS